MNNKVSSNFHSIIASGNYKTRVRIYSIPETIDCTDDNAVVANGTLLVLNPGDTDSNARISQGGLYLTDYFNKDTNIAVGDTVSCQLRMTLMNHDGALDNYDYGKFKAYLDVAANGSSSWETASLGVFYFDVPTKRKVQLVTVTARDQMQKLDAIATDWWSSLDFESGITLQDILNSLVTEVGVTADTITSTTLVNGTYEYTTPPVDATELTYRDVLAWISGAAGGIARFDRNGYLTIRFFEYAQIGSFSGDNSIVGYAVVGTAKVGKRPDAYFHLNPNVFGGGVFSLDIAEYNVAQIDKLVVKSAENDFGTIVGDGTNAYEMVDNPFMYGSSYDDVAGRAQNVYSVISNIETYRPISIKALADWAIEAGDIIYVFTDTETLPLPIFQQTLVWNGVTVSANMMSSGDALRPVSSKQNRMEFRANRSVHQLEITSDRLLSMIQATDGNFSEILQQFDSIVNTVSALDDALGSMQSQITQLSSSVEVGFNNTTDEFSDIYSFIRLIATIPNVQEGGVVIGESSNPIKLKLENDILYFFTGDEAGVDRTNAIAYFDTEKLHVNNTTIRDLTLGTDTEMLDVRILGTGDNICAFFGGRLA